MLWPMFRQALERWQFAAGRKMSSRPARSPRRSTRSTTTNYDQSNEEDTRGHISDPVRDQARDDRSFSRSTAKLTPQLLAELTGPGSLIEGSRLLAAGSCKAARSGGNPGSDRVRLVARAFRRSYLVCI